MAAGIVFHNITTAAGVTFSLACWVPDTAAPDVGAIPVSIPVSIAGAPIANPAALGSAAAAASFPVAQSAEDIARIGIITETAPGTDTASSGLNGRLQRIAQRLTTLIASWPAALGATTALNSLPVVLSSDGPFALQTGAINETAPVTDTASSGLNGRLQRIAQNLTTLITNATAATPTGTNTLGAIVSVPRATANGATSSRINAAASTNATSLKASAGNLINLDVFNVAAYDVFLKFYNKASAPTVGTDTPVWTIPIKAGTGYSRPFNVGKSFATGIAYAITKLQADSDTTVVAAGDLTGAIDWI